MAIADTYPQRHEHIEDPELNRVREFAQVIGSIAEIEPVSLEFDLADENPVLDATKRFNSYARVGIPTMYLEPPFINQSGPIEFSPRVSRGGKRSFHGVFFGDLQIGDNEPIPVAVKPHSGESALETCIGEYVNNEAIRRMNFPNLAAVGFVVDNAERAYTFTVRDDLLTTLDSMDWSEFYPDPNEDPEMQEMWVTIARQVAILHEDGNRAHGDLAARNIALTADGGILIIDWEKATLKDAPARDPEARFANSSADLSMLIESICRPPHDTFKAGIGILYGKDVDWWEAFKDIFLDEYISTRIALSQQGSHHTPQEREVKEEIKELVRSLKLDVRMMKDICETIPPPTPAG